MKTKGNKVVTTLQTILVLVLVLLQGFAIFWAEYRLQKVAEETMETGFEAFSVKRGLYATDRGPQRLDAVETELQHRMNVDRDHHNRILKLERSQ